MNQEEHGQSKNEEFENFERVLSFLLKTFFENFFFNWSFMLLPHAILLEGFLNGLSGKKLPKILIFGTFFHTIPEIFPYNSQM